jgi:hypothetical protein
MEIPPRRFYECGRNMLSNASTSNFVADRAARAEVSPWFSLVAPALAFAAIFATAVLAPDFHRRWMEGELGAIELFQVALLALAFLASLRLLRFPAVRLDPMLCAWVLLLAAGSFYVLGEEKSWGQHFAGWTTPEWWTVVNDQGETNLHNTTSWFDQKPRLILELGVIFGGLVHPLLVWCNRPLQLGRRWWWLLPTRRCVPSAIMAELGAMPERVGAMELLPLRSSEVQELFFYFFIAVYGLSLGARLQDAPRRAA